jgi:uncharacterized protein (UPF0335 family)
MSFVVHTSETAQEREERRAKKPSGDGASATIDGGHLKAFVERIERLEEEKAAIADDIKQVYAEAKGNGYDPKIIRKVVRLRKMDANKRREEDELLDLYLAALGEE